MTYRKKLIEVSLPLSVINSACYHEKSVPRRGHPATMHLWWARRPLAACRAVLFAQLVDDPSSHPEKFPTEENQRKERERLFRIIEELVKWENVNNEQILDAARQEILRSTEGNPPPVLDPFCGGGSIPLEAQRLGLKAYASDLNPIATLITKALIEIPPRFAGNPPVHPGGQTSPHWHGAKGLAEDVRHYGQWMCNETKRRIGYNFPKVKLPKEYGVNEATVVAWIWARTIKCSNPACWASVPLVRSFWLATKKGKRAWVEPVINSTNKRISFRVKTGEGTPPEGTFKNRAASCLVCKSISNLPYIRSEAQAGRMKTILVAIVGEGQRGRIYLPPDDEQEELALGAIPNWKPEERVTTPSHDVDRLPMYGMYTWGDAFTQRQLLALTTFTDVIKLTREKVIQDAIAFGLKDDRLSLTEGGNEATAYADAVATYLAFAIDKNADWCSSICTWIPSIEGVKQTFARQALPMTWDFAETNPFSNSTGNFVNHLEWVAKMIEACPYPAFPGSVAQLDATATIDQGLTEALVATDPPYYDNVGYADLSDFFYVWLRRSLGAFYPSLFSTLLAPKMQEVIVAPHRFNRDSEKAKRFFENGLAQAFSRMKDIHLHNYPLTIFYAFKQAEMVTISDANGNHSSAVVSTGWETMLRGLLDAGFSITGTWPLRTERDQGLKTGTNVLASSILLVCRHRSEDAPMTTRRDFRNTLKHELPYALKKLQQGNVAPVDMAQAAIGPGMAAFSKYSKVLEADGTPMRVRSALALINQVLDEYLAEQEGEYDADTRWALAWFEQYGMDEGLYGVAETLSKAKNTALDGLVAAGIIVSKAGKVKILRRDELPEGWDPAADKRLTVWEVTQQLIRALVDKGSEEAAAKLLRKVGSLGDVARDLAYRLYTICDRKKWAQEALAYNSLVVAWPELVKLAGQKEVSRPSQQELFQG